MSLNNLYIIYISTPVHFSKTLKNLQYFYFKAQNPIKLIFPRNNKFVRLSELSLYQRTRGENPVQEPFTTAFAI